MFKKVYSSLTFAVGLTATLNFAPSEIYGMETKEANNNTQISNHYVAGTISYSEHVIARQGKKNLLMADHDLYKFMNNPEAFERKNKTTNKKTKNENKIILGNEPENKNFLMADHDLYKFMRNPQAFRNEAKNSLENLIDVIITHDDDSYTENGSNHIIIDSDSEYFPRKKKSRK